jgi:chloramphenicol-sensitive protein RarD
LSSTTDPALDAQSLADSHAERLHASTRQGYACALSAFVCWGLFPIYWRWLSSVPSTELVCHRIVWSFIFLLAFAVFSRRGSLFGSAEGSGTKREPESDVDTPLAYTLSQMLKVTGIYTIAALLISVNWFTFIWAVNHGRVLEASLGYYINPLLSVLLGVVILGERLNRLQGVAIAIAAGGVSVMAYAGGGMPWISLALAGSFAVYGLVKKAAPLSSMNGLLIETAVLLIPAFAYVLMSESSGQGAIGQGSGLTIFLLMLGGCITVLPLALFATAAQRVPLSTMGVLQHIGPTLQFALGVLFFGEPFGTGRMVGFSLVWLGSLAFLWAGRPQIIDDGTCHDQPTHPLGVRVPQVDS